MSRLRDGRRRWRAGWSLAVGLAGLALAPAAASASRAEPTIFDAGTSLLTEGADARADDLRELHAMGVDTVRVVMPWRSLAPSPGSSTRPSSFDPADPADYPQSQWQSLDQVVRGASALGMGVLLTPSSAIPDWASSSGASELSDPLPREYRAFVAATGRRYGGSFSGDAGRPLDCPPLVCPAPSRPAPLPRVGRWALWNEPNLDVFLQPQFRDGRPYSPTLYRRLYLAGREGLAASGHGTDQVLVGETATSGGRTSVNPLDFVRGMLCMDPRFGPAGPCEPLQASGFAHHPYGYSFPPHLKPPNPSLIDVAELGRLTALLRRAYEVGATSTQLGVWVTEFGVLSVPRDFGVSPVRQVTYLAAAEYLAWREPLVRAWGQYLLRDDSPLYDVIFTTGLRYADNSAKPFRRAFPMTLLVRRIDRSSVRIWGHVRPEDGPSEVEVRVRRKGGGPSSLLRTVRTGRNGYFQLRSRYEPDLRWRAAATLADGRHIQGPFVPSLRFPLPAR